MFDAFCFCGENLKRTHLRESRFAFSNSLGQNRSYDVPLVGDLRTVAPQLTATLKDSPRKPSLDLARWLEAEKKRLADLATEAKNKPTSDVLNRILAEYQKRIGDVAAAITEEMGAPKGLANGFHVGLLGEDVREGYSVQDMVLWAPDGTLMMLARQTVAIFG